MNKAQLKVAARFDLSKSFVQKLIKMKKLKVMSNQNSRVEA